jgi:hypothetical protein
MKGCTVIYIEAKPEGAFGRWSFNGSRPGWFKVIVGKDLIKELLQYGKTNRTIEERKA